MSKKKILIVINSLGCGGAEKSLVSMLSLMDFSKYHIDLQMFTPGGMFMSLLPSEVNVLPELPYVRYCREGGKNLCFLKTKLAVSAGLRIHPKYHGASLHNAQIYWKYARKAFERLSNHYDAAIAYGQGNPTHFVAEKVDAKKKIAFINVDYNAAGYNKWFDESYYEKFTNVVLVSDILKVNMKKVYPKMYEKMITIYDIRNQAFIEKMALEGDPYEDIHGFPILVTVGRMVKHKGYDLAVETAYILKNNGYVFRWYLVGDGPERSEICKMISEKGLDGYVVSVGAKENPYPYIKNADIYVQTSRFEGYCLTLSEARALRVPPVSTDFDVVHGQIRDGENGLIVGMDPESIANGIERLLDDPDLKNDIINTLSNERIGNEEEIEKIYKLLN